jgi:hypothetical protein
MFALHVIGVMANILVATSGHLGRHALLACLEFHHQLPTS